MMKLDELAGEAALSLIIVEAAQNHLPPCFSAIASRSASANPVISFTLAASLLMLAMDLYLILERGIELRRFVIAATSGRDFEDGIAAHTQEYGLVHRCAEVEETSGPERDDFAEGNTEVRQFNGKAHIALQKPVAKTISCGGLSAASPEIITKAMSNQCARKAHRQSKPKAGNDRSEADLEVQHDHALLNRKELAQ
jgi:hypothetical protein